MCCYFDRPSKFLPPPPQFGGPVFGLPTVGPIFFSSSLRSPSSPAPLPIPPPTPVLCPAAIRPPSICLLLPSLFQTPDCHPRLRTAPGPACMRAWPAACAQATQMASSARRAGTGSAPPHQGLAGGFCTVLSTASWAAAGRRSSASFEFGGAESILSGELRRTTPARPARGELCRATPTTRAVASE